MDIEWMVWPFMALKPLFNLVANPDVRLFWAYIASGLCIAYAWHRLSGNKERFFSTFFAPDVWTSRSALNDYGILILNPVILFASLSWALAFIEQWSSSIGDLIRAAGVTGEATGASTLLLSAGLTVTLFVADDFARWAIHYLSHRVPIWWEFHKVHHSAETLNFATTERFHPVDVALTTGILVATAGLVNGTFIATFGDQLTVATVAGANALSVFFHLAGGVLRHSPAWISFGPRLERWFISPAMHQIHHSGRRKHFDRNFGGALAIWDRWFGTLYIPEGREAFPYGIGSETQEYRTLRALYILPFRKVWRKFAKVAHRRNTTH